MFKQISTIFRGKAHEAGQALADRNAVCLLAQQVRDAASVIDSARRSVAVAIAQCEQERILHRSIMARLSDLEARATVALSKGNEELVREAAEAIATLEEEREHSEQAQAQFATAIEKSKAVVRALEERLKALQRGERLARAIQDAQKLNTSAAACNLSTLDEAEHTLARLRNRQIQSEMAAQAMKAMTTSTRPDDIIEKLANAGCGAPVRTSAHDVIERLRKQASSAA